ncbi:ribosome biogenesis GTPase YlqF [Pseudorhodoferax sp. Leaf267]|uniref:ribosome biogenesis GTPase YlqF n=1 Tax=Pseudorhodoferax sp. Leaf267 TaxID=1736316 RepID=UPI0006F4CA73|nr:ribosome biogenesis GTPase YlqF [Pseudorhodoferax sp. Leaf267]KQP12231.1 ribosome biogenesis GTPase YlqF [Pseudorhodoferax sp. Leaf267]
MPIQWFPGHMHSTRKAIAERMPEIDVVIELLDARLPGSSANPMLAELTRGKPALKVLNKQDLADPAATALWLAHYQAQPGTHALALDASATAPARRLIQACRDLAPLRGGMVKPMRVLICGIPNVGKSTLVNTLRGKRAAKTGDEAGITKAEQRIVLEDDFYLYDTPGMLWPRIAIEHSGYHLAASGAVGRNAYDDEEVALALLDRMLARHPDRLQSRYKLGDLSGLNDEAVLAEIGRKRAPLLAGGRPNLHKAAEIAMHDFRSAAWGAVTLESPEEFAQWAAAAQALDAERAAKQLARKQKKVPQRGGDHP